jgi:hypothetical protein
LSSSIYLRAAASRLRAIGTNVWFMSYSKHWNSRRTWNLCFLFNFQLKKIRSKIIQITLIELWSFISFELRHLNSIKVPQKAIFGSSIFQLELKRKQIFKVRRQFQHFEYDMNQTLVIFESYWSYWRLEQDKSYQFWVEWYYLGLWGCYRGCPSLLSKYGGNLLLRSISYLNNYLSKSFWIIFLFMNLGLLEEQLLLQVRRFKKCNFSI